MNEIIDAARIFARDYHTFEIFHSFTEDEIMKGVAAATIALREAQATNELGAAWESALLDKLHAKGLLDGNREEIKRVSDIYINRIIRPMSTRRKGETE